MQREWRTVAPPAHTFVAAHFNVLADELCTPGGFAGVDERVMVWQVRREALLAVIREANPDVLSLCEADHHKDFWVPRLAALGYAPVGYAVKHADGRKTHGVALFIRTAMFKVRKVAVITEGVACVVTEMEHLACRERVTVAAVHLRAKADEAGRARQLEVVTRGIRNVMTPLVFLGDFNALSSEAALVATADPLTLRLVAPLSYTTWKTRTGAAEVKRTIDHVYARGVRALRYLDVPVGCETPLPGAHYPSDHLLVAVEFTWE